MKQAFLIGSVALLLSACLSTADVMEVGRDTYTTSATGDGYRSASDVRESVLKAGQKHCAAMGKRFTLLNEQQAATRMGIDTTITITFRCDA